MSINRLKCLLLVFVKEKDRSIKWAKSVETIIDELCGEGDNEFEELQDYLASYRPGGGKFLYDEIEMEKICLKVLEQLTTHSE